MEHKLQNPPGAGRVPSTVWPARASHHRQDADDSQVVGLAHRAVHFREAEQLAPALNQGLYDLLLVLGVVETVAGMARFLRRPQHGGSEHDAQILRVHLVVFPVAHSERRSKQM